MQLQNPGIRGQPSVGRWVAPVIFLHKPLANATADFPQLVDAHCDSIIGQHFGGYLIETLQRESPRHAATNMWYQAIRIAQQDQGTQGHPSIANCHKSLT